MAEHEQDLSKQAPLMHLPEGASLRLTDGTHELAVRKDGDTLFLQVSRDEHSLFSIAVLPDSQIHQVFDAASHNGHTSHALSRVREATPPETQKVPEYPPITIEGFAGSGGSYRDSQIRPGDMEYYVYLY